MKGLRHLGVAALLLAVAVLMLGANYMIFLYAPDEKVMGAVQRIFYVHVPVAMLTFVSTYVMLAAAIAYLWTRRPLWDHLARAATELALLCAVLVLVTGPIWAKPAWGVWWTWEAKLTTTLLLALLLAACLMVRGYADSPEHGARLASVLGIVAAVDVPIVYKAVDWWRGQHPIVFGPGKKDPLAPEMRQTLLYSMLVFFLLYGLLLFVRTWIAWCDDRARAAAETLAAREGA